AVVRRLLFDTVLRPPTSTLFPYTTLFRSTGRLSTRLTRTTKSRRSASGWSSTKYSGRVVRLTSRSFRDGGEASPRKRSQRTSTRSEEHTSELQSRENLVCRLLLEKKNTGK